MHGLQVVAVVVVAQAVWSMAHTLTPDRTRLLLALVAAGVATVLPAGAGQVVAILLGGTAGAVLLRETPGTDTGERLPMRSRSGGGSAVSCSPSSSCSCSRCRSPARS